MQGKTHGNRVLIVDDTHFFRTMLADELQAAGFAVETAGSLAQARQQIEAWHPDLVLLDNQLPDGHGLDLLRARPAQSLDPAVIMVSGSANLNDRVRALSLGAVDVLVKPCVPEELLARVQRVLTDRARLLRLQEERDRLQRRARVIEETLLPSVEQMRPLFDRLWDLCQLDDRQLGVVALDIRTNGDDAARHGIPATVGMWLQTRAGGGRIVAAADDGMPIVVMQADPARTLSAAIDMAEGLRAYIAECISPDAHIECRFGLAHSEASAAMSIDDLFAESLMRLTFPTSEPALDHLPAALAV